MQSEERRLKIKIEIYWQKILLFAAPKTKMKLIYIQTRLLGD